MYETLYTNLPRFVSKILTDNTVEIIQIQCHHFITEF